MKHVRLLAALALVAAFPGLVHAGCNGKNLLDAATPEVRAAVAGLAARVPHAQGRFWQVTRDGRSSILFGTYHAPDPAITMPDALRDRVEAARILLVEMPSDEQQRMQAALGAAPEQIVDLAGTPLSSMFSAGDWQAISSALAGHGIPEQVGERLRPWFVNLTLALPACTMANMRAGHEPLDLRIEKAALAAGAEVAGLETYPEALAALRSVPPDDYVDFLRASLPLFAVQEDMLATAKALYLQGRVQEIQAYTSFRAAEVVSPTILARVDATFRRALLEERNQRWLPRVLSEVKRGDAVIAVGALHLPGDQGLLRMLEREGFEVRRLDG